MAPVSVICCWNVWTDPQSKPSRACAKTRYERVRKKMKTRDVAMGFNLLTVGKRNVCSKLGFYRHFPLIIKFMDPAWWLLKPLLEGD